MKRHTLLNKDVTLILHGIAILMMIYHHIFLWGNTWYVDSPSSLFDYLNFFTFGLANTFQIDVVWFCRICISIFAFTSGYGIYIKYEKSNNPSIKDMYKYVVKKILSFYKKYLLMFIIFIPLCIRYYVIDPDNYTILDFVLSGLGLSYTFNDVWWYVSEYYLLVLISPLIYILLNKLKPKHYLYIIGLFGLSCVIALLTGNLVPYLKFYSKNIQTQLMMFVIIFAEGMFVSHYNLIDIVAEKINALIAIIGVIAVFVLRGLLIRAASDSLFDLVLITPFIISVVKLINVSKLKFNLLKLLGNYSTYMWFVHGYFYAVLFFRLVLRSDYSILVYIQTVIYSLATAIVLTMIEKGIEKLFNKLTKKTA